MSLDLDESTQERITSDPYEPGDHDRMSHYVDKDAMARALVEGIPTVALCGKKWLPTRDGLKFPVCPACKEIWEGLEDA